MGFGQSKRLRNDGFELPAGDGFTDAHEKALRHLGRPGVEPLRWRDVASHIVGFVDDLAAAPSAIIHDRREAALRTVWPAGYSVSRR